jgi:hypothetical protein
MAALFSMLWSRYIILFLPSFPKHITIILLNILLHMWFLFYIPSFLRNLLTRNCVFYNFPSIFAKDTLLINPWFLRAGLNSKEEAFDLVLFAHPESIHLIPTECSSKSVSCKVKCWTPPHPSPVQLPENMTALLKGIVSRDFLSLFFFHESNISSPLIHNLKPFWMKLWFRRDIWIRISYCVMAHSAE